MSASLPKAAEPRLALRRGKRFASPNRPQPRPELRFVGWGERRHSPGLVKTVFVNLLHSHFVKGSGAWLIERSVHLVSIGLW